MDAFSVEPLSEADQRDVRLITLLFGNATLLRNIEVAHKTQDGGSVSAELVQFMTMLLTEFGGGEKLLADITALASEIGIQVQQYQCGQVH